MNSLIKFIQSLLPSFDKRRIKEDLKVTRDELVETIPPFQAAKEFFMRYTMKSRAAEDMQKRFVKETGDTRTPNFIIAASRLVETVDANLSTVEKLVDRYFAEDVVKGGMTYVKGNLLQYIELMTFSIRYARHLLLWTYQVEANKLDSTSAVELTRGEIKWLEDNNTAFFKAYPILTIPKDELERTINSIPDALLTEESIPALSATVGMRKLDPLQMGFVVGTTWNVFYHFGILVAEYQNTRYKLAVEERKVLEFRLLHLREKAEGRNDPKLEKAIEYSETRLQNLKAKLFKIEEDAHD